MNLYSFTFVLENAPSIEELAEMLYPDFEGDAVPHKSEHVTYLHIDQEALSLDEALKTALETCKSLSLAVKRIELVPQETWGLEMA